MSKKEDALCPQSLAEKLDKEIDDFMEKLAAKKASEPDQPKKEFNFEEWEKEVSNHPAFMKTFPIPEDGQELPLSVQALQALKYDDEDTLEERASHFKADGNKQFQYKKYSAAVDAYTKALKLKCSDLELNAALYANRAAAHFRLQNYRSAIKDCVLAKKFQPNYEKATLRGIDCFLKLGYPNDALEWISTAEEQHFTSKDLRSLRAEAERMQKFKLRDQRKENIAAKKDLLEKVKLLSSFKERGLRFQGVTLPFETPDLFEWSSIEISLPQINLCRVTLLDATHELVWPVLFLYPEFNQTDFVEEFPENSTFDEQLKIVLADPPDWDKNSDYALDGSVEVYFHSYSQPEVLWKVSLHSTLANTLSNSHYCIAKGLPSFMLLSAKSAFHYNYLKRYSVMYNDK